MDLVFTLHDNCQAYDGYSWIQNNPKPSLTSHKNMMSYWFCKLYLEEEIHITHTTFSFSVLFYFSLIYVCRYNFIYIYIYIDPSFSSNQNLHLSTFIYTQKRVVWEENLLHTYIQKSPKFILYYRVLYPNVFSWFTYELVNGVKYPQGASRGCPWPE